MKVNNRFEQKWWIVPVDDINERRSKVEIKSGWYVGEFQLSGVLDTVPRLLIHDTNENSIERPLNGAHSGRNRMLFYLPTGKLTAISRGLVFERLARVGSIEARFRIALICLRYLRDFPKLGALLRIIIMHFQTPFEQSSQLLTFYEPARGGSAYLASLEKWRKWARLKWFFSWFVRKSRVGVIVQEHSQRKHLESLFVTPDWIGTADEPIPSDLDYLIALKESDRLRYPALYLIKRCILKAKLRPNLIYTDHDYLLDGESKLPAVFKPEPSRVYLHCVNYTGFAVVLANQLCESFSGKDLLRDDVKYQLAVTAFEDKAKVHHISEALFTSARNADPSTPPPLSDTSPWVNIAWQRDGEINRLRARSALVTKVSPSVELLIPTRDGLAVLKPCIESILAKTDYSNYAITIIDNGSEQAETLAYFDSFADNSRVSILPYPGEFNYSAINNFAVQHSQADYIGLINNDIEVISGDWLSQMMAWAEQDTVGIVGAKLLFSNGKVQHAGVTIGMGNAAGHIHRLEEGDADGYQYRCQASQNMMAVTAACLVTPRALFNELGGLNEVDFKVAYNDIDYCLRVEALGYQIIWTPEAVLYHHESVSRGDDLSDKHIERYFGELKCFQQRWKSKGFVDKYYSKHLRISDEGVFPQIERQSNDDLVVLP